MQLTHLSLTDFRNFARLDIDVPSGSVLLVGGNAQGKTNLMESIYYLATFVSLQASHDRQLIHFLAESKPFPVARIKAEFSLEAGGESGTGRKVAGHDVGKSTENHTMEARLILQPNNFNKVPRLRKEILLDGTKCKVREAVGVFNAVFFLPQMLRVIEGSPEERRRFLNLVMIQVLPRYSHTLSEYGRILMQRNALLKQIADRRGDLEQLTYWDEKLAALGAQLIHARINTIHDLEILSARIHSQLTKGQEVLRLVYQPSYDPLPDTPGQFELPLDDPLDRSNLAMESIQSGFLENLVRLREEEIARGQTTIGPHRDEIRFLGNGIDLGIYGSRGQARTCMLSLKLAEAAWMKEKTGQRPVLLLDEVLAELDPDRRLDLLTYLLRSEQVLLTTTDLDLFAPEFVQEAAVWRIKEGHLWETQDE